jgi:hypothetical protein
MLPLASFVTAVRVTVWPTEIVGLEGVTVTVATAGSVTVTVAVPVLPSLVAVIVAVPPATPVTTPDEETVAILVALELHVTVRPVSTFPAASFVVAESVVV